MYSTAFTLTEMLSRVITSCAGMSIAMMRSDTFFMRASASGTTEMPGFRVPIYLPSRNTTPRSY